MKDLVWYMRNTDGLTCYLSIVLLQLMDFGPLGSIFLVDVDFMVIGAQGNL